jgi:hypothetical protein
MELKKVYTWVILVLLIAAMLCFGEIFAHGQEKECPDSPPPISDTKPFPPNILNKDGSVDIDKYPDLAPNFFCEPDMFPKCPFDWPPIKCNPIDPNTGGTVDVSEHNLKVNIV